MWRKRKKLGGRGAGACDNFGVFVITIVMNECVCNKEGGTNRFMGRI